MKEGSIVNSRMCMNAFRVVFLIYPFCFHRLTVFVKTVCIQLSSNISVGL